MKNTGTTGTNAVDWEARVDFDRLRTERLARFKADSTPSDLGALLAFDFSNIRYMTATHIGTWAMDKLIRFSLLTRNSDPILWDFGSAAKHHALYNPWLDRRRRDRRRSARTARGCARARGSSPGRGPASRPCAAPSAPTPRSPRTREEDQARLEKFGVADQPLGVDVIELPVLFALQQLGIRVVDGQQLFMEARGSRPTTRSGC